MDKTPKSLRLHIALFGRTNVGKSSFLNLISGQDVSITSDQPGTTTDVVEKGMELLPLGPVLFIDTAGFDDNTPLGEKRIQRTLKVFERSNVAVVLCEAGVCGEAEKSIFAEAKKWNVPVIAAVTKCDLRLPDAAFCAELESLGAAKVITVSGSDTANREKYLAALKQALLEVLPEEFITPPPLLGELLPEGGLIVLLVPIDTGAPKGRLIMPQVQTIREALDKNATVITVKTGEYLKTLAMLNRKPDLVVCDSQVVHFMVENTAEDIPCTTFSILFSRLKGDLAVMASGASVLKELKDGDEVLISEACTHHAQDDDIGRVKIPNLLKKFTKAQIKISIVSGRDYPEDLSRYRLVIHCGGCMLNRKEMLSRLQSALGAGTAITNYGMAISCMQGVLDRVMHPFAAELK
jgi:[FeFe] hydrogenase H-cluster maturation GTPase HydF